MQQLLTSQRGYIMSSRCVASSAFRFGAEQTVLLRSVLKESLQDDLFCEKVRAYSTAAGSNLYAFSSQKSCFTAGKECGERERERESTLQAAQIPVCVAAAIPLRASALIKRASP